MLLEEQVTRNIERIIGNMIRVGIVVATYPAETKVRVQFFDEDDIVSHKLSVVYSKTHKDKEYWMPDIGEMVLCLFLPYGEDDGFVIGSLYNTIDKPVDSSQDVKSFTFGDGTKIEYNRNTHQLKVHSVGDITIVSDTHITLIAPRIDLNP